MRPIILAAAFCGAAASAQASVTVSFIEGAPTDRFVISSDASCETGPATVRINLDGSAGGLIFDVTAAGQGVEVFQPLTLVSGASQVMGISEISDGGTDVFVDLKTLSSAVDVAFTLDLDDTAGGREITVSGAEIEGATVIMDMPGGPYMATFNAAAKAVLGDVTCRS